MLRLSAFKIHGTVNTCKSPSLLKGTLHLMLGISIQTISCGLCNCIQTTQGVSFHSPVYFP